MVKKPRFIDSLRIPFVMPGIMPGIHDFVAQWKTWMAGTARP